MAREGLKTTSERQLEFIVYLQRILVEGDFVATYKFALLQALADICIEQIPIVGATVVGSTISIDKIAEKFIELYWQHSLPFSAADSASANSSNDESSSLLLQSNGRQAALITQLAQCRHDGIGSMAKLKLSPQWNTLFSATKQTIKKGPLWRLQRLAGQDITFLYPHDKSKHHIVLNPGVSDCFRRFYDLVVSIARTHWLQKIREIPANHKAIGGQGDLSNFLFGSARSAITHARPMLLELQKGRCFYCQKTLRETGAEVDHFIPWARYPSDLGHNFVLAHSNCNNLKCDHLAAQQHRERWYEQNIIDGRELISVELGAWFVCEPKRSEAVVTWAYQVAADNKLRFWVRGGDFETIDHHDGIAITRNVSLLENHLN